MRAPLGLKKRAFCYFKVPRYMSHRFYEIRLNLGLASRKRKGNSNLLSLNSREINQNSVDKF